MGKGTSSLGDTIRRLRLSRGMEQHLLAESSGITQSHLSKIENGKANPSLKKLRLIAEVLEYDTKSLLFEDFDIVSLNEKDEMLKHLDSELRQFISKEENTPFLEFARDIYKVGFTLEEMEALKLIFISRRDK